MAKDPSIFVPRQYQRPTGTEKADAAHQQRVTWYHEVRKDIGFADESDLIALLVKEFKFNDFREFLRWHINHYKECDLTNVKGPHWRTLLRMLAVKHRPDQYG